MKNRTKIGMIFAIPVYALFTGSIIILSTILWIIKHVLNFIGFTDAMSILLAKTKHKSFELRWNRKIEKEKTELRKKHENNNKQ